MTILLQVSALALISILHLAIINPGYVPLSEDLHITVTQASYQSTIGLAAGGIAVRHIQYSVCQMLKPVPASPSSGSHLRMSTAEGPCICSWHWLRLYWALRHQEFQPFLR
jgi:hypothetical protein